jgi:hypothetical protein
MRPNNEQLNSKTAAAMSQQLKIEQKQESDETIAP